MNQEYIDYQPYATIRVILLVVGGTDQQVSFLTKKEKIKN